MRQLRRILRLHHEGASAREIVRAVGVARSTVQDALRRAATAGLYWPLPDGMSDAELEARLFARAGVGAGTGKGMRKRPEPDWAELSRELRRPAVTMMILWEEYRKVCSSTSLWHSDAPWHPPGSYAAKTPALCRVVT